jgi:hypothetical protein
MHADQIFIIVNDRRTSLADFLAMDKATVVSVYASGCTALTSVDLPAAKTVYARGCTALTSVDLPAAEYVYASGCTALTSVDLPAAKTVYASGCTALTSVDLPAAKTVYARGCTALTSVDLPAAEYVYASGCTALTSVIDAGQNARGYDTSAIKLRGEWRIVAGCRNFNIDEARKHWGRGSTRAHPTIAAQVEEIAAEIERREVAPLAATEAA